ncbi:MAG: nucleoside triphosphate pyrophosphohydrolase [Desulfobacterales bacterium]|nr:nucleoside triphosphate pyrophosphohydrolase [Desulfobacterales bacterium]
MSSASDFDRLVTLVETLRSDHGCPWDREQTTEQIKLYLIEEAYEVLEAIESGAPEEVCSELGDLLFHIVFVARIFEEAEKFSMGDVVRTISEKMIRRHPHVFGDAQVSSSDEVRHRWHEIKKAEAKDKDTDKDSFLASVPQKLPALMRAYRIGERAAKVGFDWPDIEGVIKKLDEELAEFKAALKKANSEKSAEEFGDLLFTMVNLGRLMRVHPEAALARTVLKFIERFEIIEKTLREQGRTLDSASLEEMDAIWEQCKQAGRG